MYRTNSFGTYSTQQTKQGKYHLYSLNTLEKAGITSISMLPFSLKILLESLLRNEAKFPSAAEDIIRLARWHSSAGDVEIPFMPARVILQDSAGIPALVDLASLREILAKKGYDISGINTSVPVDLVIDHSVQVDSYGSAESLAQNVLKEYERNQERYQFLKWAQQSFKRFRVVPPSNGIIHQVNLEYLAQVVQQQASKEGILLYPDSLVGTDSHTTMINGLGVLGWGVGGIEAEAIMLGNPTNMLIPDVIGVKLTGDVHEAVTATDMALTITQVLRQKGVVGKFVEFYGPGLEQLSLPDRATIANMAPEYGASMGYFPIDNETLNYLRLSGRNKELVETIEWYAKEQGLFYSISAEEPVYSDYLEIDLSTIAVSIAGPKRPQDRIPLTKAKESFQQTLHLPRTQDGFGVVQTVGPEIYKRSEKESLSFALTHGSLVIAAITSCTNTSNPVNMLGAGLLAKNAIARGLEVPKYVKTTLAPGSKVVTGYLNKAGLTPYLERLGFFNVGYGCTTCVGNSGPLEQEIEQKIRAEDLVVASILSGNRNFEARIHPSVKANYLASPPMVIAFALAGRIDIHFESECIGRDHDGKEVFLRDIWPSRQEIQDYMDRYLSVELFREEYEHLFAGDSNWNQLQSNSGDLYRWKEDSTYFKLAPFFQEAGGAAERKTIRTTIENARALLVLGDSVTTDHISPVGMIQQNSAAGQYLLAHGVDPIDFNSYGSRRGNHEVLVRGTFANPRIKNQLVHNEGGYTTHHPSGQIMSVYEAAMTYRLEQTPLMILAGKEYGTGSARDWAAKGTALLGVRAVLAESFERIHRGNLAMMGVLPLQFFEGQGHYKLGLTGEEYFSIEDLDGNLMPRQTARVTATRLDGSELTFEVMVRLDTKLEVEYFLKGGIFQKVIKDFFHN